MPERSFGARVGYGPIPAAAETQPSSNVTGLSSRQVLFGSSDGHIAQDALFQYDSTNGRLGIGTSAPTARFTAIPPNVTTGLAFDWYTSAGTHFGVINSSGHVGIGTTAPVRHLDVNAPNQIPARFGTTASGGAQIEFTEGAAAIGYVGYGGFVMSGATTADIVVASESTAGSVRLGYKGGAALIAHQNHVIVGVTTAQSVGFFGSTGSTRPVGYATTGTTGRTMNSTITPAAVYTSDVGAQLNALQGVVKTLIQDLTGMGQLASTV